MAPAAVVALQHTGSNSPLARTRGLGASLAAGAVATGGSGSGPEKEQMLASAEVALGVVTRQQSQGHH